LDGGLLLGGIDLHQGRAVGNLFAGVDEDLCNDAFDLRHDHGGVAGLQGSDVVGGVVDPLSLRGLHFDGMAWPVAGGFGLIALAAGVENRSAATSVAAESERRSCDDSSIVI